MGKHGILFTTNVTNFPTYKDCMQFFKFYCYVLVYEHLSYERHNIKYKLDNV